MHYRKYVSVWNKSVVCAAISFERHSIKPANKNEFYDRTYSYRYISNTGAEEMLIFHSGHFHNVNLNVFLFRCLNLILVFRPTRSRQSFRNKTLATKTTNGDSNDFNMWFPKLLRTLFIISYSGGIFFNHFAGRECSQFIISEI